MICKCIKYNVRYDVYLCLKSPLYHMLITSLRCNKFKLFRYVLRYIDIHQMYEYNGRYYSYTVIYKHVFSYVKGPDLPKYYNELKNKQKPLSCILYCTFMVCEAVLTGNAEIIADVVAYITRHMAKIHHRYIMTTALVQYVKKHKRYDAVTDLLVENGAVIEAECYLDDKLFESCVCNRDYITVIDILRRSRYKLHVYFLFYMDMASLDRRMIQTFGQNGVDLHIRESDLFVNYDNLEYEDNDDIIPSLLSEGNVDVFIWLVEYCQENRYTVLKWMVEYANDKSNAQYDTFESVRRKVYGYLADLTSLQHICRMAVNLTNVELYERCLPNQTKRYLEYGY